MQKHGWRQAALILGAVAGVFASTATAQDLFHYTSWSRLTNDPAHYSAQPGGVQALNVQMAENYPAGNWIIRHGITDDSGFTSWIHELQREDVTLASNTRYLVVLTAGGGIEIDAEADRLGVYPEPGEGYARIYVRNEDPEHWRGICVLPESNIADEHVSRCGNQGY